MIQIDARIIASLDLVVCRRERVLYRWQIAERIIIVQVDRRGDLYHCGVHRRYRPSDRRLRPEN